METSNPSDMTDQQAEQFFAESAPQSGSPPAEPSAPEAGSPPKEVSESASSPGPAPVERTEIDNLKAARDEERHRRKELQDRVRLMEDRFQQMLTTVQRPTEEPKIPAPEEDLAGHITARLNHTERALAEALQRNQEVDRQARAAGQTDQMLNRYRAEAAAFAAREPSFTSAYSALVQSRIEDYTAAGFAPHEAANIAYQEELAIAYKAHADGVNPAERIYALAKRRGLVKATPGGLSAGNGATIMNAAERTAPLAGVRGDSPRANVTLEQLAQMDEKEFQANWDKLMRPRK